MPNGGPMEHTVTYQQAYPAPEAPAVHPQQPQQPPHPQQGHPQQERPGANLSRDPSDPDRPFVTAGQISGSRTPPPERQQQLWDTVFGEEGQDRKDMDDLSYDDDEPGKPIWVFALAGSVAIALIAALLWAFLAGPLAGDADPTDPPAGTTKTGGASTPPKKTTTTIKGIKKYPGQPAPVTGTLPDQQAGLSVPRLGGTWLLDQRPVVQNTYGYDTRQYVKLGPGSFANLMTGPLPATLAANFTSKDELEPAIKAVVVQARKRFFPKGNTVRKIGQQKIKNGEVIAYELTSPEGKATIVTAAINTGKEVPAIVYMSVPEAGTQLLPDINTVLKQVKVAA